MDLQIQNEKIDIKKSIGRKSKNFCIEKDFILPDSKPDIIKIQNESTNLYISKKENMENKTRIDGGVSLRITYITGDGKSRVLKTEETFSEMLEMQGITETTFVNEKVNVTSVQVNILNERKIHFKIDMYCEINVSTKENIEIVHEINPIHQLQILNKSTQIDSFIGRGETKVSVKEKLEIENVQEDIEIVKISPTIKNIETKMSYNKVLVKADCTITCLYTTEGGMAYITKKESPIMGFLDINNVEDTNECNIEFTLKNISAVEENKQMNSTINVEMEFNIVGDVYQSKDINLLEDLYCLNNNLKFAKRTISAESCHKQILETNMIKKKIVIEDINQVYDLEYQILNSKVVGNSIEGEIKLNFLYSSFETPGINSKEEIISFSLGMSQTQLNASINVTNSKFMILPDSSVDIELNVEIVSNNMNSQTIELISEIEIGEECNDDGYSMTVYFVKDGDSLWKIAKKFKSTVKEIANINDIKNEEKINIGDKLYIPRAI